MLSENYFLYGLSIIDNQCLLTTSFADFKFRGILFPKIMSNLVGPSLRQFKIYKKSYQYIKFYGTMKKSTTHLTFKL